MAEFSKLSETPSKIIYNLLNGLLGTIEYDKETKNITLIDQNGMKYHSSDILLAFSKVIDNNFPDEYVYAAG